MEARIRERNVARVGEVLADQSHAGRNAALHAARLGSRQRRLGRGQRLAVLRIIERERAVQPAHHEGLVVRSQSKAGRPVGLHLEQKALGERVGVPDLDRAVVRRRDEHLAALAVGQLQNRPLVGEARVQDRIRAFLAVVADLPHTDAIVDPAGGEPFAVRTERHRVQRLEGFRKRVPPRSGRHVPQLDGSIIAGAGQQHSVRPKRQAKHGTVVPGQRTDLVARLDVPQLDPLVIASGGQGRPVRRQGHGIHAVTMAFERALQCPVGHVPQPHFTELPRLASGRGQPLAVRREGQCVDVAPMSAQRMHHGVAGRRDEFDFAVSGQRDPLAVRGEGHRGNRTAHRRGRRDLRNRGRG